MELHRSLVLTAAVLAAGGCTADDERNEARVGPVEYTVSYIVAAAEYDEEASQSAFDACVGLPGASFARSDDIRPPRLVVLFEGSVTEQRDVAGCLRSLRGSRLSGPRSSTPGG